MVIENECYPMSFCWGEEEVLKIDHGDGRTTLNMLRTTGTL